MILKWLFDRIVAFLGLAVLWPVLVIVAILVKVKMPGGLLSLCRRGLDSAASCLTVISSVR